MNKNKVFYNDSRIRHYWSQRLSTYIRYDIYRGSQPRCDYTLEELKDALENNACHYCGSVKKLTLDRIDDFEGHTRENTVVACESCNKERGSKHYLIYLAEKRAQEFKETCLKAIEELSSEEQILEEIKI